jgi:hypothetical protein
MKLTYFVNAMILMEGRSSKVLCDPWITFDDKSSSGLFNFPRSKMTRADIAALKPDYIYITHTHADHFDPETLSLFSKDTPVIVAPFENNFTARNVRKIGFHDVRIAHPTDGLALNGNDHCWIEVSATYPEVDSLGVFRIDDQFILNANDNPFDEAQCASIAARFGRIDLCCVPFGFQGPYPAFYENLATAEKAHEANERKLANYRQLSGYVRTIRPRRLFAFAGGAIYGGSKARLHPYYGVGTAEEAVQAAQKEFSFEPVFLSEGCGYELETGKISGNVRHITYADDEAYINKIAEAPGPFDLGGQFYVDPSQCIDLSSLLEKAREKQISWARHTGRKPELVYFLDLNQGPLYRLCFDEPGVKRVKESDITDPAYEIFRLPYPLMIGLLTGHYNWSNVKTQFVSFYRHPNRFDRDLHVLMSYLQL